LDTVSTNSPWRVGAKLVAMSMETATRYREVILTAFRVGSESGAPVVSVHL